MPRAAEHAPTLTIRSRAELRSWLAAHHTSPGPIWLACYKKHHPDYIGPTGPITEELLCWGWINSVVRALDEDRSMILISPRNPKSAWSAVNKAHVARARASGAMTPAGEAKILAAQENGQWDFLNDVDALIAPDDLISALQVSGQTPFWDATPKSIRRGTLEWIKMTKTPATRAARITDVVISATQGLRPSPFRR